MRRPKALAVLVIMTVALCAGCATAYPNDASQIASDATLNNGSAIGAAQQSVSAEWAIRDYDALIVTQNTEQAYLLCGVVGLLSLSFLTSLVALGRLNRTNKELVALRMSVSRPPGEAEGR
jgi:hypothetical protein